jgi:Tfp pilus assembly protein PilF
MESRAKEALRLGDPALAHQRLTEGLALDPYHPLSTIELAESLAQQGKYAEAATYYQRAARLGPYGTALAYNMAGECLRKAGEDALAEDCFVQALRIDPHAVSAARGWQRTAGPALAQLAGEYADGLTAWGESRRKAKP